MNYKYKLDKSSKKYHCPSCQKKTFVRFVDQESKLLLEGNYGRCDRESNCGYFLQPNYQNVSPILINKKPLPKPISYHTDRELQLTLNASGNNFLTYLSNIFDSEKIDHLKGLFRIGSSHQKWDNSTVFWQIDQDHRIHAGKMMQYDPNTGNRVKKPYNHISWMHRANDKNEFNLSQCLFGLHLLYIPPFIKGVKNEVRIVESEKTAVIMFGLFPQYIWMATGSNSNFKLQLLKPLKNYKVVAYPDKSEFEKWNKVAIELNMSGFHIKVSSILENLDLEKGADLIDLLENV